MTGDADFRLLVCRGTKLEADLPIPGSRQIILNGEEVRAVPLPSTEAALCIVEPIHRPQHSPELVLRGTGSNPGLTVNGLPVPVVSVLCDGAELALPGSSAVVHVTRYLAAAVGAPAPEMVGRTCPICKQAITSDTLSVYTCACGVVLHAETKDQKDDPSDCASLAAVCPGCGLTILSNEGGYSSWPEGVER